MAASLTILDKYTVTYNANGGSVGSSSIATAFFVVGDTALQLPTPTRANYTFTGWYTLQLAGIQRVGDYTPVATSTLWAHWVQNSLFGMGGHTKILSMTTLPGAGNTYSVSAGGGTVAIEYLADALPDGTIIDGYLLSDTSTASSVLGAGNDYVMALVLAWVATDGTVPTTAPGKAISMTITNSVIKKGAKVYSVIGNTSTLLGRAAVDGSAVISITDDPQIVIAITKPDAPSAVAATSGADTSSVISWTAPSDGGASVTSYTATSNTGQTCTTVTTTCSITGLTNGTAYTFSVTATNALGISASSPNSSPATPAAPAAAPVATVTPTLSALEIAAMEAKKAAEAKAAAEFKAQEEIRAASAKKITTVYSTSTKFRMTTTYARRVIAVSRSLTAGSIVTCIGYSQISKSISHSKARATGLGQAKALCASMKKSNRALITKSVVYPGSKAPKSAVNKKWIPVSYRVQSAAN